MGVGEHPGLPQAAGPASHSDPPTIETRRPLVLIAQRGLVVPRVGRGLRNNRKNIVLVEEDVLLVVNFDLRA